LAILHTPPSEFDKHGATLRNNNNGDNLLTAHLRAGLYSVKVSQLAFALTASTADVLHDWHFRLGHLNVKDVMRLSRAGRIEGQSSVWKRCKRFHLQFLHLVKAACHLQFPIDNRSQQPISIVHIDLWGLATTPSIGGCRYFLTCYDDCTRKIHLSFFKQKSDAFTSMMLQELSVNSFARSSPSDQIMAVNSTRQHGTPTCNLAKVPPVLKMVELNEFI